MESQANATKNSNSNLIAALAYLWVASLFVMFFRRDDPFVLFHARQGTALFIISLLAMVLSFVLFYLGPLIWCLVVVMEVIGFTKALAGEKYNLPVIGRLVEKK